MPAKFPDEVETRERDEMVCPECFTEGLEENPAYTDEYSGQAALLQATRCPNEDCPNHYGVEPEEIERQLASPSLKERFIPGAGGEDDGINKQSVLQVVVVILGIFVVMSMLMGGGGNPITGDNGDGPGTGPGGNNSTNGDNTNGNNTNNDTDNNNDNNDNDNNDNDNNDNNNDNDNNDNNNGNNTNSGGGTYRLVGTVDSPSSSTGTTVTLINRSTGETLQTTVGSDGTYEFNNLYKSNYRIEISPPTGTSLVAPPSGVINISQTGEATIITGDGFSATGNTITFVLRNARHSEETRIVSNATAQFNVVNPANSQNNVKVTLEPISAETVRAGAAVESGKTRNVFVPGVISDQSVTVTATPSSSDRVSVRQYRGTAQTISISGSVAPERAVFNISDDAGLSSQQKTSVIDGTGTFNLNVTGGPTEGEATLELQGSSRNSTESISGIWRRSDPTITIQEESSPSTVDVSITGIIETTEETERGTIESGRISTSVSGSLPPTNAKITFNGGNILNEPLGSETAQSSAINGSDSTSKTIATVSSSGTYTLDLEHIIDQNPDLVTAGYSVNGEKTRIGEGTSTKTLSLESGDSVSVWVETEQETHSNDKNYEGDSSSVTIESTSASPTDIEPGGSVSVQVTLHNPTDSTSSKPLTLFVDGQSTGSTSRSVGPGETKTVSLGSVSFDEEGVHTVSVNDKDPITISVGSGSPRYGKGEITGTLTPKSGGKVEVDTNNDGSYDCTVAADGGTCTLSNLNTGENQIDVNQLNVENTDYTIQYTSRTGASDISVDIDNDGTNEISHDGVLPAGETISGQAELSEGSHSIDIQTGNRGPVNYTISWQKTTAVEDLSIQVDGETIESDLSFSGTKTISLGVLSEGEHTISLESSTDVPIRSKVEWVERSQYPSLSIDGTVVCNSETFQENQECSISGDYLSPGDHQIMFSGGASSFQYGISYTVTEAPEEVTLIINGEEKTFQRALADENRDDGSWSSTSSISLFNRGTNTVQVVEPNRGTAAASFEYEFEAVRPLSPELVVTDSNGETTTVDIPADAIDANGFLKRSVTVVIPQSAISKGENSVEINLENRGVVNATIETDLWETQELRWEDDSE